MTRKELKKLRKSINSDIRLIELLMLILDTTDVQEEDKRTVPAVKEDVVARLDGISNRFRAAVEEISSEIEAMKAKV